MIQHSRRFLVTLIAALCLLPSSASAWNLYVNGAADTWNTNEFGGHGIFLVHLALPLGDWLLVAELNTDTALLRTQRQFGKVQLGGQVRAEALFGGLLIHHFVAGEDQPELGFYASFVEAQVDAKTNLATHWFTLSLGARQWAFSAFEEENIVFPPNLLAAYAQLSWAWWEIAHDSSWSDPHRRARRRIEGFGLGIDVSAELRNESGEFGVEGRNPGEKEILSLRQWGAWGVDLSPIARLQIRQWAGWGFNEDDLTRMRVGGQNPYVLPVPGLPWAAFLAQRYVGGEVAQSFRLWGETEIGFTANGVVLDDPRREGDFDEFGNVIGASLFLDFRHGPWQANAAIGLSPDTGYLANSLNYGAYVDLGRSF